MAKQKLTDEQKQEAYRLYTENGYTYKKIAEKYEISIPTAVRVINDQEKAHRLDDLSKAPLACDLTEDAAQTAQQGTPQSVLDAISDTIALLSIEIDERTQSIKQQQAEVDAMQARLDELRKWKEEHGC